MYTICVQVLYKSEAALPLHQFSTLTIYIHTIGVDSKQFTWCFEIDSWLISYCANQLQDNPSLHLCKASWVYKLLCFAYIYGKHGFIQNVCSLLSLINSGLLHVLYINVCLLFEFYRYNIICYTHFHSRIQ